MECPNLNTFTVTNLVTELCYISQDSNIYLIGTWDGLIHKCSCSNTQHYLETYRSHLVSVNIQNDIDNDIYWFTSYIQDLTCMVNIIF